MTIRDPAAFLYVFDEVNNQWIPARALVDVDGSLTVLGPLTDAELRASPVAVSGPLTDVELRATAVPVSTASLPLPAGAATSALQGTGNTSLSSIDTKTPALVTGRVPVDGSGVTQPVSAAALPLPAGASTAALQTTGNSSLSSIDAKNPALVSGRVPVDGSGVTQPVSGPLTDAQLRATAVPVALASVPLPTGGATSALQTTGNTSLSSIDTKTPALVTGRVPVDGSGVTQPMSAAALPLPAGASTSALQTTGNASLSSIDTKTPALVTGRVPVDGSGVTQPISAASLPLPTGGATSALQTTGNTSLGSIDTKTPALVTGRVPVDASGTTVTVTGPLTDAQLRATPVPTAVAVRTPTTTSVGSSITSVTLQAANANRRGLSISNISTSNLYASFTNPATVANCFAELPPGSFVLWDQQLIATSAIFGIWSAVNGAAQVTEYV